MVARGWESKSVEEQMEAAAERKATREKLRLSDEQVELLKKRESLEMTRTRVLQDLSTACNARYRQQLEAALRHVEEQLRGLVVPE